MAWSLEGDARNPLRNSAGLVVHTAADPRRGELEQLVQAVYWERYGARVSSFAPKLVSLNDGPRILAVAGYRVATQALFLERYLDAPIEQVLARHAGEPPRRDCIVEVGHLAAARPGDGRRLIVLLAAHLAEQRLRWVVSTLTRELRHLFVRMGLTPLALGAAEPARLGNQAAEWGRYYDHSPVVLAGHLPQVLRCLRKAGA